MTVGMSVTVPRQSIANKNLPESTLVFFETGVLSLDTDGETKNGVGE